MVLRVPAALARGRALSWAGLTSSCCHACLSPLVGRFSGLDSAGPVVRSRTARVVAVAAGISGSSCCHARALPSLVTVVGGGSASSSCCHAPASPLHSSRTLTTRLSGSCCCRARTARFSSTQSSVRPQRVQSLSRIAETSFRISVFAGPRRSLSCCHATGGPSSPRRSVNPCRSPLLSRTAVFLLSPAVLSADRTSPVVVPGLRTPPPGKRMRTLDLRGRARWFQTTQAENVQRCCRRTVVDPSPGPRRPAVSLSPPVTRSWLSHVSASSGRGRGSQVRQGIAAGHHYAQWSPPLCAARTLGCPGEMSPARSPSPDHGRHTARPVVYGRSQPGEVKSARTRNRSAGWFTGWRLWRLPSHVRTFVLLVNFLAIWRR